MLNVKIVGIDASLTGTGICVMDYRPSLDIKEDSGMAWATERIKTCRIETDKRGPARLIEIRDRVLKLCHDAALVIIEGYAYAMANQAHQMGELGGVLRVALTEAGIKYIEVTPGQLKKFACGKQNAKKEEVMLGVYKRWGMEFPSNDECDAFVLARIGEVLQGDKSVKYNATQMEVIEAIQAGGKVKKVKGKAGGGGSKNKKAAGGKRGRSDV